MDRAIIVIDNTQGFTPSCEEMMSFVEEKSVPYIIFANKQDLSNTPIYTQYPDVVVIPSAAISGRGISKGMNTLLKFMESEHTSKIRAISC